MHSQSTAFQQCSTAYAPAPFVYSLASGYKIASINSRDLPSVRSQSVSFSTSAPNNVLIGAELPQVPDLSQPADSKQPAYPESYYDDHGKIILQNLTLKQTTQWLDLQGIKTQRANQLYMWRYRLTAKYGLVKTLLDSVGKQNGFSRSFIQQIGEISSSDEILTEVERHRSSDGTIKLVLQIGQGSLKSKTIETVIMPRASSQLDDAQLGTRNRITICVSSQVGCAMNCQFCYTGRQGKGGNLSPAQIVDQVVTGARVARELYGGVENVFVVFMGMGEPLDNVENVLQAIQILQEPTGMALSSKSVLVSTMGLADVINDLPTPLPFLLGVSLHATEDDTRDWLVPPNRRYNLSTLLATLQTRFATSEKQRACGTIPLMVQYLLLKHVNDSDEDAARLVAMLKGLNCYVNLIMFNPHPGTIFTAVDKAEAIRFQRILQDGGVRTFIRFSKGSGDMAGCGQLSGGRTGASFAVPLSIPPERFRAKLELQGVLQ